MSSVLSDYENENTKCVLSEGDVSEWSIDAKLIPMLASPQRMFMLPANTAVKPIARKVTTLPRWKVPTADDPGVATGEVLTVVIVGDAEVKKPDDDGDDDKGVVEVTSAVVEGVVITGVSVVDVNVDVGVITTSDVDDVEVTNEVVLVLVSIDPSPP